MSQANTAICVALSVLLAGCGTLMHPERRGQTGGRLDVGIVILDGIGLLFFLIPGLIAFAVDFSEGTIYLPGGGATGGPDEMKVVTFDTKHATPAAIEEIIWQETGYRIKLHQADMQVSRLGSPEEIGERFAKVLPEAKGFRLALNAQ